MKQLSNKSCENAIYRLYDVALIYIGKKPMKELVEEVDSSFQKMTEELNGMKIITSPLEFSRLNYKVFLANKEITIQHYREHLLKYALFLVSLSRFSYRFLKFVFHFFSDVCFYIKPKIIPKKENAP